MKVIIHKTICFLFLVSCSLFLVSNCTFSHFVLSHNTQNIVQQKDSLDLQIELIPIKSIGSTGKNSGQFIKQMGISIDPDGNLWVADTGNDRVQKFDSGGNFLLEIGKTGTGKSEFSQPVDVSAENGFYLYVSESKNQRIQKFRLNGTFQNIIPISNNNKKVSLYGLASGKLNEVFVSEDEEDKIIVIGTSNNILRSFGIYGRGNEYLNNPKGIAIDNKGRLYIADSGNDCIKIFDLYGGYEKTIGANKLKSPSGVSIDRHNNIYVADTGNNSIKVFSEHNELISYQEKYGDTLLSSPTDVLIVNSQTEDYDKLYVSDTGNDRILVFKLKIKQK